MTRTVQVFAVLAGAAALVTGTATFATAHARPTPDSKYEYKMIRKGIPDSAVRFTLRSPDVHDGGDFPAVDWAGAFGCSGDNHQPRLSWSGAPTGTRSYAVTMYDPDAPTGSGFWQWLEWDIPAGSAALGATPPAGTILGVDDAGQTGYLGPCPPTGDIAHRYQITVYALNTASLGLPAATPAAVTASTISGHVIGYAQLTATARR